MRFNYETCIVGHRSILVPYRSEHVETYHEWMKDPYLLEMTASEPLSLEEEINMQKSWKNDNDKCTFIILFKGLCHGIPSKEDIESGEDVIDKPEFIIDNIPAMIGDVNLFLTNVCETNDDDTKNLKEAELDIMIAVQNYRNKGIGKEVVKLILYYGITKLNVSRFFVKIKDNNTVSLKLFQESFGFSMCGYTECFREYELEYIVHENTLDSTDYYEFCSSTTEE